MRSKIITILLLLGICISGMGQTLQTAQKMDSVKVDSLNQAASNPDFIQAYLLVISEGKAFYSVYGHAALRMVCKEKGLDYCFTFEMDMNKSSYLDVFTRKAKAGFAPVPTSQFLDSYKQEGRGVKAFLLNLQPKEKQNLWKVLDEEAMNVRLYIRQLYVDGDLCHQQGDCSCRSKVEDFATGGEGRYGRVDGLCVSSLPLGTSHHALRALECQGWRG